MEVIESAAALREATDRARAGGSSVGFVATMGALHEGHARLLRQARDERGVVVLSIFVNPLQFLKGEDLSAYPRPFDRDRELAERIGVDVLFHPAEAELYPNGPPEVTVDPGPLGDRYEGAIRPGHFRGVLTVVAKLLHLVGPSGAYFGQKDAQQLALVRRMVADLDLPVEVVAVPTAREPDGLALSSRNAYLSKEDRAAAPVLFEALSDAATAVRSGERDADVLRAGMARTIGGTAPPPRVDYVAVVDARTWAELRTVEGPALALAAARFSSTRLIDNLALPWDGGDGVLQ
jgi:pantoate--beta-alanine ligase